MTDALRSLQRLTLGVGVTAATAVLSLAVAPHAAADKTDEAFLASLRQAKISYGDATQAVAAGKKVCDMADKRQKAPDVVQAVKTTILESATKVRPGSPSSRRTGIAPLS